jgi:hypothetical protein
MTLPGVFAKQVFFKVRLEPFVGNSFQVGDDKCDPFFFACPLVYDFEIMGASDSKGYHFVSV